MDSFIDKFAQKRNAQELIKANYMAEAQENERLTAQVAGYDAAIQEIRKQNLQNIENAEKVRQLLEESLQKINDIQVQVKNPEKDETADIAEMLSAQKTSLEELLEAQKTAMTTMLKDADESNHRESVKVYRNVQAVVEENQTKQTEELKKIVQNVVDENRVPAPLLPLAIITLIAVAADITVHVLQILGLI